MPTDRPLLGARSLRALLLLVLAGCAGNVMLPPTSMATSEATTLGPGDIFEVRIYQEPDLSGVYRVSSDGTISFPLLGRLEVSGKETVEVADLITGGLKNGFIKNPQVSILVKEYNSKKVFILGQVARPGAFPFSDDMSIVNAIALAGGFTKTASPNHTNVTRVINNKETRIGVRVGDIGKGEEKNFQLAPGDIVYVPESFF